MRIPVSLSVFAEYRLPGWLLVIVLLATSVIAAPCHGQAQNESSDGLKVGVARANITPPADAALKMSGYGDRPEGFEGIHDSLYTRAIVLQNDERQAAILVNDLIATSEQLWHDVSRRIEEELQIPSERVMIAATHTHGGPTYYDTDEASTKRTSYRASVTERMIDAVGEAQASVEPARMGVGTGRANINVNRVAETVDGAWWIGRDQDGVSDKTVHVVKFENLDGDPLAVLVNYGVHAVVMGPDNLQITGDVPGATSRYVRDELGGEVIVPWTSGAAGDQNPIYGPRGEFGDRRESSENLGRILGKEVVKVANSIDAWDRNVRIRGRQKVVTVPGKEETSYQADGDYDFGSADPVDIRLSLLMLDYVALTGVSGEVLTGIGLRLKKESPVEQTVMLTHTNGSVGYIPTDEAYETPSYEVVSGSRIMSGAEEAVVDGLLELIDHAR